ncbi:MAG: HAMP domain-containing histidine kinase [Verrucomicrobia bacterium]|jgi:signal transduction histidine kinase|nr:HAMP domain-containing histidine kinase [Verrucomicrobiota bacterium]MBT7701181.1 HAMP domain-containing histidine kinase [Verrucomicrobiota bacterium]
MKRWTNRIHLSSRGARVHFAVAVALISVIPCLTLFYLYSSSAGSLPLTPTQWLAAGLGIAGAMVFGYVLLGRYPATIIRLRACLQNVVEGDLTDGVDLSATEEDTLAIEEALNAVLEMLRGKLQATEEQKARLENELFQSQKLEAIGTLAAGIAHEVNTPLQFLSNNLQFIGKACRDLLAAAPHRSEPTGTPNGVASTTERELKNREFLEAEIPRAFMQWEEGIARIAQIIKAIQDFTKGEEGGDQSPIDLNKAIEATIEVTRNEWKYDADLETDLEPGLPFVTCFPGEIKRTVMELVLNAKQAVVAAQQERGRGTGQIRITTRRDGDYVLLSVADDGCGVSGDIRDRIFDPFFTTREIGAGKGCGLAFVQAAVVKRHNGKLSFATEERGGSTFTVSLPLDGHPRHGRGGQSSESTGKLVVLSKVL